MTSSLSALDAAPTFVIADEPTASTGRLRRLVTRAAIVGALAGGAWLVGSALGSNSASAAVVPPLTPPASQDASAGASPVVSLLPVVAEPVNTTITSANALVARTVESTTTTVTTARSAANHTVAALVTTSTTAVATTTQVVNAAVSSTTGVLTSTVDAASTTLTTTTGSLTTALTTGENAARSVGATVLPVASISAPVTMTSTMLAAVVHGSPIARAAALSAVAATLAVGIAGVGIAGGVGVGGTGGPGAPSAPTTPAGPGQILSSNTGASSAFDRVLNRSWRAVAGLFGLLASAVVAAGCTLFYDSPAFSPD